MDSKISVYAWKGPKIVFLSTAVPVDNKHYMTGPEGNSGFCFPRIFVSKEIGGKQNLLFPKGPVIK